MTVSTDVCIEVYFGGGKLCKGIVVMDVAVVKIVSGMANYESDYMDGKRIVTDEILGLETYLIEGSCNIFLAWGDL